jgi:hypothetical protein
MYRWPGGYCCTTDRVAQTDESVDFGGEFVIRAANEKLRKCHFVGPLSFWEGDFDETFFVRFSQKVVLVLILLNMREADCIFFFFSSRYCDSVGAFNDLHLFFVNGHVDWTSWPNFGDDFLWCGESASPMAEMGKVCALLHRLLCYAIRTVRVTLTVVTRLR